MTWENFEKRTVTDRKVYVFLNKYLKFVLLINNKNFQNRTLLPKIFIFIKLVITHDRI